MNYRTNGIVLKRMNFGEADRILTILTERFGKVKAIAKGVRKIKSKLAGSLEPFMLLDLQLHEGKSFYVVTGSVIDKEFEKTHSNLSKVSRCFYIAELIDKFLQEDHKAPEVFELFSAILEQIDSKNDDFWLRVAELKLIEISGFHPELYECLHCREKLTLSENFWDNTEGGVICGDCQQKFHHGHAYRQAGKQISNDLIKFFRFIEKNSLLDIEKLKIESKLQKEAEVILSDYIESILEREIKSKSFLNTCTK